MEKTQEKKEFQEILVGKTSTDLIEILHKTQDLYGYIPKENIFEIAQALDLPVSKIYGVITFYSRFSMIPKGEYQISVCNGTACYVKGAEDILAEFSKQLDIGIGETTDDLLFSLVETRCLGDCSKAPVVMVNDQVFGHVTVEDVKSILEEVSKVKK